MGIRSASMTIQRAAEESGVSPSTLRLYERLGLLRPGRDNTNRRLYSPGDVAQAKAIAARREANRGVGLRNSSSRADAVTTP